MTTLSDDQAVIGRVLAHIDGHSTDLSAVTWREPVANYISAPRLAQELRVFRRQPTLFCPSAARPRWAGPGVPQRVPPPRGAGRGGRRLPDGVCLPVPRLDLRPRWRAAPRAPRARLPGARGGAAGTGRGGLGGARRVRVRHAGAAGVRGHRPRRAGRGTAGRVTAGADQRAGDPGELEDPDGGLPGGLPPAGDPQGHVLSPPVRQPERGRAV